MNTILSRSSKGTLLTSVVLMLSGCFGGGSSGINSDALTTTSNGARVPSSLNKLDNVEGTMGYAMDVDEKTFTSSQALSSKLSRQSGGSNLNVTTGPNFSAKKNFNGGLDIEIDGQSVSLTSAEMIADTAWYKTSGSNNSKFSLSLWNAGKDERGGLLANAAGQNYHKIIGYDYTDNATTTQARGHVVYGEATPLSTVQDLQRTATYHGYFSVFITPEKMSGNHYDNNSAIMSGGAQFFADFDKNTISGQSTDVQLRESGSHTFNNQNINVRFETADIVNDGNGGAVYKGKIASEHSRMDGAKFNGSFFGAEAQETAGVITGETTETSSGKAQVVDGFFSAAR